MRGAGATRGNIAPSLTWLCRVKTCHGGGSGSRSLRTTMCNYTVHGPGRARSGPGQAENFAFFLRLDPQVHHRRIRIPTPSLTKHPETANALTPSQPSHNKPSQCKDGTHAVRSESARPPRLRRHVYSSPRVSRTSRSVHLINISSFVPIVPRAWIPSPSPST